MGWRLKIGAAQVIAIATAVIVLISCMHAFVYFGWYAAVAARDGLFARATFVQCASVILPMFAYLAMTISIIPTFLAFRRATMAFVVSFAVLASSAFISVAVWGVVYSGMNSSWRMSNYPFSTQNVWMMTIFNYAGALLVFILVQLTRRMKTQIARGFSSAGVKTVYVVDADDDITAHCGVLFELKTGTCVLFAYRAPGDEGARDAVGHIEDWGDASSFGFFRKACLETCWWGESGVRVTDGTLQWREPYVYAIKITASVNKMSRMRAYAQLLALDISSGETSFADGRIFAERILEAGGVDASVLADTMEACASGDSAVVCPEEIGVTSLELIDLRAKPVR